MPDDHLKKLRGVAYNYLIQKDIDKDAAEYYTTFAVFFVYCTSARVNEGIKLIRDESCRIRKSGDKMGYTKYFAQMHAGTTKTKAPYTFYLPDEYKKVWMIGHKHEFVIPHKDKTLYSKTYKRHNQLFQETGIVDPGYEPTMRSIRRNIGSKWMRAVVEAKLAGIKPPPNPLQHKSTKTVQDHYATKQDTSV